MTRRLAREEGIFAGNSAGAAMAGVIQLAEHFRKGDVVVVVFHDHGSRYMGKMYNDEWMGAKGFLEVTGTTARDLVATGVSGELFTVEAAHSVEEAARLMSLHDFSQVSITKEGRIIGSLNETHLYEEIVRSLSVKKEPVEAIMQPAFPFVDISTPVELLATMITPGNPAVLIRDFKTDKTFIITRSDVIRVLM
jgi:cystathionine beta-synthase